MWVVRMNFFIIFSFILKTYADMKLPSMGLALMAWILVENTLIYSSKVNRLSSSFNNMEDNVILDGRYLQLSDVRIPLIFVSGIFSFRYYTEEIA